MLRLLIVSLSTAAPQSEHEHLQYFLKPETVLTSENIAQVVQFGTVQGAPVYALLRLMTSVYVPRCLGDTSWPDTIKKEFTSQMHRFMASLTECAWDQRGTTRLYIPSKEGLDTPEVAAKQKELAQRLESTLIHWTRQIKEVVNRQEEGSDNSGAPTTQAGVELLDTTLSYRDAIKRCVETKRADDPLDCMLMILLITC